MRSFLTATDPARCVRFSEHHLTVRRFKALASREMPVRVLSSSKPLKLPYFLVITVLLLGIISPSLSWSAVYECRDEKGRKAFTDRPCKGGEELEIEVYQPPVQIEKSPTVKDSEASDQAPPEEDGDEPDASEEPAPKKPAFRRFNCGDLRIVGLEPYVNIVSAWGTRAAGQFQCATVTFKVRPGLTPRINDRDYADEIADSLGAYLADGKYRTSNMAYMPDNQLVAWFKAGRKHKLQICFGASSHPVKRLVCKKR